MIKTIKTDQYWLLVEQYSQRPAIPFVRTMASGNIEILNNKQDAMYGGCHILAHLPIGNAPLLEGVNLLPKQEKDVRELALAHLKLIKCVAVGTSWQTYDEDIFIAGYKVASQEKKYSEEDMRKAIRMAREQDYEPIQDGDLFFVYTEDQVLQSLSPTQEWEFEPEWETDDYWDGGYLHQGPPTGEIKTIPNPEAGKPNIVQGQWKLKNK